MTAAAEPGRREGRMDRQHTDARMVHPESPSGFVFAGLAGAETFNLRLNFAVEEAYGPLPIALACIWPQGSLCGFYGALSRNP